RPGPSPPPVPGNARCASGAGRAASAPSSASRSQPSTISNGSTALIRRSQTGRPARYRKTTLASLQGPRQSVKASRARPSSSARRKARSISRFRVRGSVLGPPRSGDRSNIPHTRGSGRRPRWCPPVNVFRGCAVEPGRAQNFITSEQEDRMTHVKRTIGLVAAVLVLAVTALTVQAQPQFGGTWTLDNSQSQFPAHEGRHGQSGPDGAQGQSQPPVVKLVVEQNGTNFKVTRSMARDNKERAYTQSFVADGSERTEHGHRGASTVTKATLGGDSLVTTSSTMMTGKGGGVAKRVSPEVARRGS